MLPIPRSPQWFPWMAGLVCALIASFLLPRHDPFPYAVKSGHFWKYQDLRAPFDFEAARPAGEGAVAPVGDVYYQLDPAVGRAQKLRLTELINTQVKISKQDAQYEDLVVNSRAYSAYGQALLDAIYKRGIIKERPDGTHFVLLNTGNTTLKVPSDSLLLVRDALEVVTDSLPFSTLRQPELLLPLIEKVLSPNIFYSDSLTSLHLGGRLAGQAGTGIAVKAGELIIRKGEQITPEKAAVLHALSALLQDTNTWKVDAGYLIFCILGMFSLLGWLRFYRPAAFYNKDRLLLALVLVPLVLLLILGCYSLGAAVPLMLPLYLMPLMLRPLFGLRTSIVIWSVPVILTGFALDWGMLWVSVQIAGAGLGLMQNGRVESWTDRVKALGYIFGAQTMVWLAFVLAEKAPDTIWTTDTVVFLAIAAILSIAQSVLVRFFQVR